MYENLPYTDFSAEDPTKFLQDPDPIFHDSKDLTQNLGREKKYPVRLDTLLGCSMTFDDFLPF